MLALALGACTTTTPAPAPTLAGDAPLHLTLIAFNDFHGQLSSPTEGTVIANGSPAKAGTSAANSTSVIAGASAPATVRLPTGGAAWLAGLVAQIKARNPLNAVVAAGDLIGASPLNSALFHDEPSIEALNLAGLEFSAVGNHEFDHGPAELLRMQNGGCATDGPRASCHGHTFTGARFRYLAANVTDASSGRPVFPAAGLKTFTLATGGTLKVGFIGAVLKGVPDIVVAAAAQGLVFSDEAIAINAAVPALRAQGAEVIVVLIHEGGVTTATAFDDATCPDFSGDILPIVDRLDPAIDAVISGHTHRTYICRRNGRLVTSAGSQGRYLTDIELTLDAKSHRVIDSNARQIAVTNNVATNPAPARYPTAPIDPEVQSLVEQYTADAAPLAERVVARIEADITRQASAAGETALGDLIADAELAATAASGDGNAQIALMNSSGVRADLSAKNGHVTYGDIHAVHPFGNSLITLSLTGAQLHALLEQQWLGGSSLFQISSGFSYEWQSTAPSGARVDVASVRLNGRPIDPQAVYRITTNEFLAGGGDGYKGFAAGTERLRGMLDSEALEKYAAAHSPLRVPAGGRILRKPSNP